METSYCSANQRTGFYMITASVMKELNDSLYYKINSSVDRMLLHCTSSLMEKMKEKCLLLSKKAIVYQWWWKKKINYQFGRSHTIFLIDGVKTKGGVHLCNFLHSFWKYGAFIMNRNEILTFFQQRLLWYCNKFPYTRNEKVHGFSSNSFHRTHIPYCLWTRAKHWGRKKLLKIW